MMKKLFIPLSIILFTTLLTLFSAEVEAQCAMCRAVVENNITSGASKKGAGLNTGILYLMIIPYIAFATLGYLWYKNTQKK